MLAQNPLLSIWFMPKQTTPRNIFGEALYHEQARFWAHKDLAFITLLTARKLNQDHGYSLELKDCLRTIDAPNRNG